MAALYKYPADHPLSLGFLNNVSVLFAILLFPAAVLNKSKLLK